MFKTVVADTAGSNLTTRRRHVFRPVAVGMVVIVVSLAVWVRGELRAFSEIDLVVECDIPDELPTEVHREPAPGRAQSSAPYVLRPREEYRISFAEGFEDCRNLFLGLREAGWFRDTNSPPERYFGGRRLRRKSNLRWVVAENNSAKAEQLGHAACLQQLQSWADRFGVARVRRALLWKYGSPADVAGCMADDSLDVIRYVLPVLIAGAVIVALVKISNRTASRANAPPGGILQHPD